MNFKLTDENYYSHEAGRAYMSNSQYSDYLACPAAAQEKHVRGHKSKHEPVYFLAGRLFHILLLEPQNVPDDLANSEYRQLCYKTGAKKGQLLAAYQWVEKAVARLQAQPALQPLLQGGTAEQIYTGMIAGIPWRAKLDYVSTVIFDAKSAKSIEHYWDSEWKEYRPWYEKYNYPRQFAIYQDLVFQETGERLPVVIGAATKDYEPEIDIFELSQTERFKLELDEIADNREALLSWWANKPGQRRCERCNWCRKTKVIDSVRVEELG